MFASDLRWAYATSVPTVWNRIRPQRLHTLPDARGFLILRPQQIAGPKGFPACWTTCLADDHAPHKDGFLAPDEVAHVQQTARRLAAILLLGPDLDAAHATCADA